MNPTKFKDGNKYIMTHLYDIDVCVESDKWAGGPFGEDSSEMVQRIVSIVLGKLDYPHRCEVSVLLCDDARIQELNKKYRQKDKPTNVLSFPQEDLHFGHLGDVILSFDTIEKEAREQKKTFSDHVTHLVVHGVLHLLGYDHEEEGEAQRMESQEVVLLEAMGVENPYT